MRNLKHLCELENVSFWNILFSFGRKPVETNASVHCHTRFVCTQMTETHTHFVLTKLLNYRLKNENNILSNMILSEKNISLWTYNISIMNVCFDSLNVLNRNVLDSWNIFISKCHQLRKYNPARQYSYSAFIAHSASRIWYLFLHISSWQYHCG